MVEDNSAALDHDYLPKCKQNQSQDLIPFDLSSRCEQAWMFFVVFVVVDDVFPWIRSETTSSIFHTKSKLNTEARLMRT